MLPKGCTDVHPFLEHPYDYSFLPNRSVIHCSQRLTLELANITLHNITNMEKLKQLINEAISKIAITPKSELQSDLLKVYEQLDNIASRLEQRQKQLDYQEEMLDRHINQLEEVKHAWDNRVKVLMN